MNNNLLIVGAGQYGLVVYEIAKAMKNFEKIDFIDDKKNFAIAVLDEYNVLARKYFYAFPAIGDSALRLEWLSKLEKAGYKIPNLISNKAYVSQSAKLGKGIAVEPMAVVHSNTVIGDSCIISANATVNHNSVCEAGCHINCGAVIESNCVVPARTKVNCGEVFKSKKV